MESDILGSFGYQEKRFVTEKTIDLIKNEVSQQKTRHFTKSGEMYYILPDGCYYYKGWYYSKEKISKIIDID